MLLKGSLAEIYGRENLKNPPVEQSQNALCLLNLWASFPTDWDNMLCLRSISKLGDLADCNQCSKGLWDGTMYGSNNEPFADPGDDFAGRLTEDGISKKCNGQSMLITILHTI